MHTFEDTMTVWKVFEGLQQAGKVRAIGISNIYKITVLQKLYQNAIIKPSFVQNRFYAETGYDHEIRAFCLEKGIRYQSFWTLTANPRVINRYCKKATLFGVLLYFATLMAGL